MHDIHTHLYWHSYDADRDEVIRRARAAGVKKLFVIGCTVEESRACVALTQEYPEMYAAVGIHPQEFFVSKDEASIMTEMSTLRDLAREPSVVAIGECGLEYSTHDPTKPITEEQKAAQKEGFLAQIALAQELSLPMILHCRAATGSADAYEDLFALLQSKVSQLKSVILHCYMGDTAVTEKFLTLPNVSFSFTGNITYPVKKAVIGTKDDLTETVKLIPLNRIFTETDCPFLTPQSHRGERNEPAYVAEVVQAIASIQGVSALLVENATDDNFKRVFPRLAE